MKKKSPWGNPNAMPNTPMWQTPTQTAPSVPMTPPMVHAIRQSPKGVIPPGLAKWLAAHKKGKKNG